MLTLVHLLYAHAADDLLILPHKPKSEANSLVETLTSLDRETHQCAADFNFPYYRRRASSVCS